MHLLTHGDSSLDRGAREFGHAVEGHRSPVDNVAGLTKARSLLMILLATCKETQLALDAVANLLDTDLTKDLGSMIDRSELELVELTAKIEALSAA